MTVSEKNITGLRELQEFMDQLTPKMERNVMRGGLRAGMKVIQPVAQGMIHRVSGLLADGLKIGTRSSGSQVWSYMRATGPHAFLAKWLEFGTRPHKINAAPGRWLSLRGGRFAKTVDHPGASPHPFARPALDAMATPAVVAAAEYIKKRLATKHGLDTSEVLIEGDE